MKKFFTIGLFILFANSFFAQTNSIQNRDATAIIQQCVLISQVENYYKNQRIENKKLDQQLEECLEKNEFSKNIGATYFLDDTLDVLEKSMAFALNYQYPMVVKSAKIKRRKAKIELRYGSGVPNLRIKLKKRKSFWYVLGVKELKD